MDMASLETNTWNSQALHETIQVDETFDSKKKPKDSSQELNCPVDHEKTNNDETPSTRKISYWQFLVTNRNYRYFLLSFLITHLGEWLTYLASIDMIERTRQAQGQEISRTAISILVLVRLLPNVLLSSLGGSMADALDRKYNMMILDFSGALCAFLFVYAYQCQSVPLLYLATFLQQSIAGLYEPSHSAMIPLLVRSDAELKKATTLEGLTWSAMQAFGAAASGLIVDALGIRMCFLLDSLTYLVSVFFLGLVRGSYKVVHSDNEQRQSDPNSKQEDQNLPETPFEHVKRMVVDGVRYLRSSYFGALVFLKGTAALGYGACDVLNVAFAEDSLALAAHSRTSNNSRLGLLFSLVGIGCLLGPIGAEPFIHVERPKTVQASCVIAFGMSAVGYLGWGIVPRFGAVAAFSVLRAAGSSNIWIHSNLLLQKFSAPHMLGRVMAADYAIALINEALAAFVCGVVMDKAHWSPYDVSLVLAVLTAFLTIVWGSYHLSGRGAGQFPSGSFHHNTSRDPSITNERSALL